MHCATAKAKPVGTSQTSHTLSLKRPCPATGRDKIVPKKPRTKSSTNSGNATRETGDFPTRRSDRRTQAPWHNGQLDRSAKKLIPEWRKAPSTQPPLSSREAHGSSGTKVQSSPLTQRVQESYSSSAGIAPDISSGGDFGGFNMGTSSMVSCEPSTLVQQSEMPARVTVTPSETKDNRSFAEIADFFLFIEGFLQNRNFQVRLGSCLSQVYDLEMGVPQGSILSVTLFGLKINSYRKDYLPRT